MSPGTALARRVIAALVLLLHLALLAWWSQGDRRERSAAAEVPRVSVRLIAAARPAVATPERVPTPTSSRPSVARARAPVNRSAPASAVITAPAPQAITLASPAPAASPPSPEAPPSLMDGEATRRAIRAAAREPGIATQAGRQGPALQTPDERLGSEVQRSARGDCLKGEYVGGGMGLLSLPFLAAAALRDQCRR